MTYEEFKSTITKKLANYLPEEYKEITVQFSQTQKVNETYESAIFSVPGHRCSPTINIEERYNAGCTSMQELADLLVQSFANAPTLDLSKGNILDNLFFEVINTDMNADLIKKIPHIDVCGDLVGIYRMKVGENLNEMESLIVTNQLLKQADISEEELLRATTKSTDIILPPVSKSLSDMIYEITGVREPEQNMMYVMTNELKMFGANVLVNDTRLQEMADTLCGNFYIIPSSIHEVLAVPDNKPAEMLQNIVKDVNNTQLRENEILSYKVFHYCAKTHCLSVAAE